MCIRDSRTGVAPGTPRFYMPHCPICEKKLAAGEVFITDPQGPPRLTAKERGWNFTKRREQPR
jgi:hypothetical protein